MRFLAIGECMAELAPTGDPGTYQLGFAGDTFNTAWYLTHCAPRVDVSYLTAIGDDAISAQMRAAFRESGIDDRFVGVSSGKTVGLYLISLDRGERSFSYWRGQSAARDLADDRELMHRAMASADLIFFSGITLAILSPERRNDLLGAVQSARARGATIAFDPNLRRRLWASDDEMTGAIMQAAKVSDVVLPSFEDEASWFGDADPDATADRYLNVGANTVVVKNGAGPVLYVDTDTRSEIAVTAADDVVDSTAAGDSFNAGFFAYHAVDATLTARIKYACALSRQVIGQRGALVPINVADLPAVS